MQGATVGFYGLAHVLVGVGYLAVAWMLWRGLAPARAPAPWFRHSAMLVLFVAHAALLMRDVAAGPGWHFGFAQALSATLVLAVVVIWVEGLFVPLRGMDVLVLPAAGCAVVLPALFAGVPISHAMDSTALRLHLATAILAYGLLTIAALHAALMAVLDRRLHAPAAGTNPLSRVFAQMPPLLALERLLFHLIAGGFLLLTATLVSGVVYTEMRFGQLLRLDHKTVFTVASWLVFAGLLLGRYGFGWRGRIALRWTFAGFLMLMLAYVGSRFVLEVVLHRF